MEQKDKIVVYSVRISEENKERLDRIKEEMGAVSQNELFDNIIDRFTSPIKVNKNNEIKITELEKTIEQMKATAIVESETTSLHDIQQKETIEKLKAEIEQMKATPQKDAAELLQQNEMIVALDPLNKLVVEYVAQTEGKRRGQDWQPEDVINYFIYSRFVKGELNGNLDSVPDNVIVKLKKELQ